MKIGYARTSSLEQVAGLEAQIRELNAAGCNKLYTEQTSSVAYRAELAAALEHIQKGDVLVVAKIDRLARSVTHLGQITQQLRDKGAHLQILNLGIDTTNATGELILNVMGSIAQFERGMMLERQREGIAKAKAEGKYRGRTPSVRKKAGEILKLNNKGLRPEEIAEHLKIGRSSVYRVLSSRK